VEEKGKSSRTARSVSAPKTAEKRARGVEGEDTSGKPCQHGAAEHSYENRDFRAKWDNKMKKKSK
jgi:hypothetical protein